MPGLDEGLLVATGDGRQQMGSALCVRWKAVGRRRSIQSPHSPFR